MITDELMGKIKSKGIIKIDNFLNIKETSKIQNLIKFYSAPKDDPKSYFPINYKSALLKIFTLNLYKFYHSIQIINIEKRKNLLKFSNNFFGKKSKLRYIDAYYSKKSNKEILPWHTDQAYSGKIKISNFNNPNDFFLKIFIYLSDVGPGNGCMSYIPESHKIGYAVRKGIFNKQINYQPYWRLKDFKKIIQDNLVYFENYFKETNILYNFLKKTDDLVKLESNDSYSYEAKAGSAIIFDEGGVHRGSKPLHNDRMVLRYMYSRDN